jgi:hypothetical protein
MRRGALAVVGGVTGMVVLAPDAAVQAASLAAEGTELLRLHDFCEWAVPSWTASDLAGVCDWEYVECNSGNLHVQELRVTPGGSSFACDLTGFDDDTSFDPENLAYVQTWHLAGLGLTGPPPESFFQLPSLLELNLAENELSGSIAGYDVTSPALQTIFLFGNQLSGDLCDLTRHTRITNVDISDNLFSGDLPARLGTQERLVSLRASGNRFAGPLPDFSAGQSHLSVLRLDANLFSGSIPAHIGQIGGGGTGAREIVLRGNQLTGAVPEEVAYLGSTLQTLDLSGNLLGGHLPAALSYLCVFGCLRVLGCDHAVRTNQRVRLLPPASPYCRRRRCR